MKEIDEMIEALAELQCSIEQIERNVENCNSAIDHINSGCEVPLSLNNWWIRSPKKVRKVMEVLRDFELADLAYLKEFQNNLRVSVKLVTRDIDKELSVKDILEYIDKVK